MPEVPARSKAVLVQEDHSVAVEEVDTVQPSGNQILLKVEAIAQNPTDWKHAGFMPKGSRVGADACGKVVALGPQAEGLASLGQRRAGFVRAINGKGSFAEYTLFEADLTWLVPDNVSSEEAASTPIPFFTVVQLLYIRLELPPPPATTNAWIYIHSGATSVGFFAIQLAKLSGLKIIASSSPGNHQLLRDLGADKVVSYKDADFVEQVKQASNGGVKYAIDCITEYGSLEQVGKTISPEGGIVGAIRPSTDPLPPYVSFRPTLVYTMHNEDHNIGDAVYKTVPQDRPMLVEWCKRLTDLTQHGKIRFPKLTKRGGLDAVNEGFEHMKSGGVSGEKLIYTV